MWDTLKYCIFEHLDVHEEENPHFAGKMAVQTITPGNDLRLETFTFIYNLISVLMCKTISDKLQHIWY